MKTKTTVERDDRGSHKVHEQGRRFVGLYLAPVVALPLAWLIHAWAYGVTLAGRTYGGDEALQTGTLLVLGMAIVGLTAFAYRLVAHRDAPLRWALAVSVSVLGTLFAWNVGTGPHYVISGAFLFLSWILASAWVIPRLHVARKDPREKDDGDDKDSIWSRMGVSKKTKFKSRIVEDEETGEPLRLEAEVLHAPGETVSVFHDGGIDMMASAAAAPPNLGSATGDSDRADRSRVVLPLVDPFKRVVPVGPLSAPGKSIGEWRSISDNAVGDCVWFTIANGIGLPTPTSYALCGMTRSGKSATETAMLTEFGSSCDWVLLYLNQAKGLQDIRPLLPITEVAFITEDGDAGLNEYWTAIKQVRAIMAYRQQQLARYAVSAWSPRCADPDPAKRPSLLKSDGTRDVMPAMPFLTVHIAEADSIFSHSRLSEDVIFVASKGLSLGVDVGLSLQKPDYKSMPTNVRSQIGLWFVHGLAEEGDEEFVIDLEMRKAGVRPGKWGQEKPGQHFLIGHGVKDKDKQTVANKTRFIVGSDRDENGRKLTFDELNDRYMAEMLRRNLESAKTQAKLDRGSAEATGGWWDEQAARTTDLRNRMLNPQAATAGETASSPASPQPQAPQAATASPHAAAASTPAILRGKPRPQPQPQAADDAGEEPTADELDEAHEEAASMNEVEGINLYPDPAIRDVDLTVPPAPLPVFQSPEDDPLYDAEEEAKPEARTRAEAVALLSEALEGLLADESLRDPKDATGQTVILKPGMVAERCKARSRPWVQAELRELQMSRGDLAQRYLLTLAEDLGLRTGKYRLRRIGDHSK